MIKWITKELFWCTFFMLILFWFGIIKTQDNFYGFIFGWFAVSLVIASLKSTPKPKAEE